MAVGDRKQILLREDIPLVTPIANGGTGATTKEGALSNLGINVTATEVNNYKSQIGTANTEITAVKNTVSGKSDKSKTSNITLASGTWAGTSAPYTYTVTVNGVTTTNVVEILPQPTVTLAQVDEIANARIATATQATNSLVLKAFGDKPTINLPITIIIRGDL